MPGTFRRILVQGGMEGATVNEKPLLLFTSLPVENVQSLAASKNLSEIPERYIRPDIDACQLHDVVAKHEIPIIDLHRLLSTQHSVYEAVKLTFACEEWGFFQLINHGVPDDVTEKMKREVEEFFQLPLEEKEVFAQPPDTLEGYGQAFVQSEDQKLDWGDMFFIHTQPITKRKMELWPTNPQSFRDTVDKYSMELKRVTKNLLELIAKDLGFHPERLTDMFKEGLQSLRMNYYPPCPHADKVFGISPHSDAVGLTLLLQVSEVKGLQIMKNGGWIPIKPLPGAIIVNIGDILEIMSNGRYKSIEHRAIINTEKERISIAAFHSPNLDVSIGPLPELVERDATRYMTLSFESYRKLVFSNKLDGKSLLDHMKLEK